MAKNENKDVKVGFCRYCGVSHMLPEAKGKTQEEWDDEATADCNCNEAQKVRWKAAVLETFAEDMKGLDISPKVRGFLEKGAELIADGVISYAQVKTDADAVVKISKKSSGIFLRKTTTATEKLLSEGMYKQ